MRQFRQDSSNQYYAALFHIVEEGNGKSTLLKLLYSEELTGDYAHYTGEIIRDGLLAYLPQFMGENEQHLTVTEI